MLQFPVRKCFHVFKICLLLVLVVTILAMFEQWRGGKRSARAQYSDPAELEYEKQIQEDEARIIPGLGEGGVAAHLMGEDKRLGEESEKKLAINVHLSDRIAYNRTLKDYRNPACQRVVYDAELPSASVVIIFHNEPYSVVVRTMWSVLNSARRDNPWFQKANYVDRASGRTMTLGYPGQDPNSPFVYLKEIILVDDNSTLPELKGKLSYYVRTRLPPDLIRILRLPDRVGLTRARLAGARYAGGDTLVFLDAHCEGQQDWLRPLLQRIKDTQRAVVVPIIDVVDASSFYYSVQDPKVFQVGGFSFMGHFTWIEVPEREKKRRGSDISPTWSPTMAGGLFAIDRAYYWEIGAYDEQMAGWGGENLEMSFRIWMCGGTLETIPCSRVGHVFRSFHPYGLPAHTDTHGINTARMAEVWMDEYAELFYLHRPDLRNNPKIGDVTHRKVLREKLRCKSFQWYLDNIYREKFVPVRDVYGYGRFKNPPSNMCLDTLQREGNAAALGIYPCHSRLQATQYFSLSSKGELRDEESCAELQHSREEGIDKARRVLMADCHGKRRGQKWRFLPTGQLQHVDSGLCLDAGFEAGADILARTCQDSPAQRWEIDYSQDNNFHLSNYDSQDEDKVVYYTNDVVPNSLEERLSKLRSQRRISRSLLSADNGTARRRTRKRRGKKRSRNHKRRVKNKFILKLVRTLPNNSEEHLEVDIHCSHKRLYPNNSFVRDLVSVLNDKDIKVINNGRVFEKNKVTELSKAAPRERKVLHKLEIAEFPPDPQPPPAQPLPPIQPKKLLKKRKPGHVIPLVKPDTHPPTTHKKIIIEDFVEVPAALSLDEIAPQRAIKRRKKKRPRTTTPPVTEPATPARSAEVSTSPPEAGAEQALAKALEQAGADAAERSDGDRDALLELLSHKRGKGKEDVRVTRIYSAEEVVKAEPSAEDAPMLSSSEIKRHAASDRDAGSTETWPIGESRFRSNESDAGRRKARRGHVDTDRDSDRERDRERGHSDGDSDRGRGSERDRDSDRGRVSERDSDSERDRDSDRGRVSERDSDSDRVRESERERYEDRDHRTSEGMSEGEPGVYHARHALMERNDPRATIPVEDKRSSRMQQRADALAAAGTSAPVKLVMRSNLTFNLGDDFFAWRAHPDNNEVLDELTIPSNDSHTIPLAKAWAPPDADRNRGLDRKPDRGQDHERNSDRNSGLDRESGRSREQEHIITGNGVGSPREASEDDSSASDSGDHS